ncbi:hypothetical protein HO133_003047 [Letharia lupina]|uniref:Nodulin-like domain-containing protein n=1 Tax=Letharia lupina TaxID=560253 RepID=A0A8H6CCA2_9LECA|nr:uncharacterized protein HO133_003047 [Letharia lupina]KAF6220614.1 hypothetical protein HO133_003047 [Letharia lupina]
MSGNRLRTARVLSVIAATLISLACGTNYAYSAWAPAFAEKLKLSSTQSNLIGTFGNLGMYSAGIPIGLLVDTRGPRPGALLGAVSLGVGYFSLYRAYDGGPGSISLPWLCFFAFLTGVGGCASFAGAVKTSALNWPDHRGAATAFPLSAFGLSAFVFASVSSLAFPDNTLDLLLLLAIATFTIPFIGSFLLRIVPVPQSYDPLPGSLERSGSDASTLLQRSKSEDSRHIVRHLSHEPDIRGLAMLSHTKFYLLWVLMGLLTGLGIMTINNIGSDARALWHHYDDSASSEFVQERQLMHVEILSFMSFCGRLTSGIGSDIIVRKLGMSRFWCLFISSTIFLFAQVCGTQIDNPHLLGFLSGLTGLAYGFLFGVYPALVAETFGVNGFSQNWGSMTLAPIVFGNIFNLVYGHIYDRHSIILPGGQRDCKDGLYCYRNAYFVTLGASLVGVGISLWSIHHDWIANLKKRKERERAREA